MIWYCKQSVDWSHWVQKDEACAGIIWNWRRFRESPEDRARHDQTLAPNKWTHIVWLPLNTVCAQNRVLMAGIMHRPWANAISWWLNRPICPRSGTRANHSQQHLKWQSLRTRNSKTNFPTWFRIFQVNFLIYIYYLYVIICWYRLYLLLFISLLFWLFSRKRGGLFICKTTLTVCRPIVTRKPASLWGFAQLDVTRWQMHHILFSRAKSTRTGNIFAKRTAKWKKT